MSKKLTKAIEDQEIIDCIRIIRGQKVMLDRDLARMFRSLEYTPGCGSSC
ncbi:hypothetical protein [Niastella sp. OAS944]|nr:hypothetical protein [Chitinophagaceae bacterium OAS944]